MKLPKNYFHDRTVLSLLGANMALFLLSFLGVILGLNPSENPTSIVAYRDTTKIGQISGPTEELYQFAVFSVVVTVASIILSLKIYPKRRHLAVGLLGMNILLLIMSIIIFNALTRTL